MNQQRENDIALEVANGIDTAEFAYDFNSDRYIAEFARRYLAAIRAEQELPAGGEEYKINQHFGTAPCKVERKSDGTIVVTIRGEGLK